MKISIISIFTFGLAVFFVSALTHAPVSAQSTATPAPFVSGSFSEIGCSLGIYSPHGGAPNIMLEYLDGGLKWRMYGFESVPNAPANTLVNKWCKTDSGLLNADNPPYTFLKWDNQRPVSARIGVSSGANPLAGYNGSGWYNNNPGQWLNGGCMSEPSGRRVYFHVPLYYDGDCRQALNMDDAGLVEIKPEGESAYKMILYHGMDECAPSLPAHNPAANVRTGNAGNGFVRDNCVSKPYNSASPYNSITNAGDPGGASWGSLVPRKAKDCSDSANFSWYEPYLGGSTSLDSVIGKRPDGTLKSLNIFFKVKSTVQGGMSSRVFISLGYPCKNNDPKCCDEDPSQAECDPGICPPTNNAACCLQNPTFQNCPPGGGGGGVCPILAGYEIGKEFSANPGTVDRDAGVGYYVQFTPSLDTAGVGLQAEYNGSLSYWPVGYGFRSRVTRTAAGGICDQAAAPTAEARRQIRRTTPATQFFDQTENPIVLSGTFKRYESDRVSIGDIDAGQEICGEITVPQPTNVLMATVNFRTESRRVFIGDRPPLNPTGNYGNEDYGSATYWIVRSYTYRYIRSGSPLVVPDCEITADRRPYFKVFGGEWVGGGVCNNGGGVIGGEVSDAKIVANAEYPTVGNTSFLRGSSSQGAAFAGGSISGFFSSSLVRLTGIQQPFDRSSFANSTGANGGDYGLVPHDSTGRCIKNTYRSVAAGTNTDTDIYIPRPASGVVTLSDLRDDICPLVSADPSDGRRNKFAFIPGDVKIRGTTVGCPKMARISVGGSITIEADISNVQLASPVINIDPDVTLLTRVYLSAPPVGGNLTNNQSSKGAIYTCRRSDGTSSGDICNRQLTVVGSLSAQKVILGRTYGNVAEALPRGGCQREGVNGETINYSPGVNISSVPYSGTQVNCTNAAEVFINTFTVDTQQLYDSDKIDSITSLPPVF